MKDLSSNPKHLYKKPGMAPDCYNSNAMGDRDRRITRTCWSLESAAATSQENKKKNNRT